MKIAVDCGHTLNSADYGAVGIKSESLLTREVGKEVIRLFKNEGHSVVDCTIDNAGSLSSSLSYRYNTANNNNCDYYISIHFNAFNGSANGTEVLVYNNADSRVNGVLSSITALGFTNRGVKQRKNLAVLKNTKMKAMLIECCFCDNTKDMNLFNGSKMAKAIVEGFLSKTINLGSANNNITTSENISKNSWIERLQRECNNQGFSNQVVDGIAGPNTLNGCPTLRFGSRGNITKLFQEKLVSLGYNTNGVDGIFGLGTKKAVVEFQKSKGLAQDGVVGRNTWKSILEL